MAAITQTYTYRVAPERVFAALTEGGHLRAWWSEVAEGEAQEGATVAVTFRPHGDHATFRVERLEPGRLVRWRCTDSRMLGTREWEGTTLTFRLDAADEGTRLELSHDGWAAETECFRMCTDGWSHFLGASLKEYLESGTGQPVPDRPPE